jgi:CMP-N-acetylneuraminic acid synthetase
MRVLGLIPARGGSKGVPRKNIRLLAGKPLLQYTAEAALAARQLSRVVLTTEDLEIAEVGKRCGLDVPFLRPQELAQDSTPTLPVIQHALRWLANNGDNFDAVCLLQPTSPLRTAEIIDGCIDLFQQYQADCVVTMAAVPEKYNPHWVYFKNEQGFMQISTGEKDPIPRRQALSSAYHREGSVYVTKTTIVMEKNSLYGERLVGYILNEANLVNIDTLQDWENAEKLMSRKIGNA